MGNFFVFRRQDSTDKSTKNHIEIFDDPGIYRIGIHPSGIGVTTYGLNGHMGHHRSTRHAFRNSLAGRIGVGGHHSAMQPIYDDSDQDAGVEDLNSVSEENYADVE